MDDVSKLPSVEYIVSRCVLQVVKFVVEHKDDFNPVSVPLEWKKTYGSYDEWELSHKIVIGIKEALPDETFGVELAIVDDEVYHSYQVCVIFEDDSSYSYVEQE